MTLKKILMIDDDDDIRMVGKLTLEKVGGWDVDIAGSGTVGIDKAKTFEPDLILLDVMMPGMDGPEVLNKLNSQADLWDIPVVFMTAKVQVEEKQRLLALGAVGVLEKPFDPVELPSKIREIYSKVG